MSIIRIILIGVAWGWLIPSSFTSSNESRLYVCIRKFATSVLVGLLFSILPLLFLLETGWFTPIVELVLSAILITVGMLAGFLRMKHRFLSHLANCMPGAAVFVLGCLLIMALPHAGEWVLGGLDPGIYLGQGVNVARTGTFHPAPQECFAELSDEELRQFTRGDGDYVECFPGIAIDPDSKAFRHYFFRLTPTLISMAARDGGLRAAVRVNYFVGMMTAVMLAGCLVAFRVSLSQIILSVLFLVVQPLWLYHLHLPTTEMLQLLLILGMGMLLPVRSKGVFPLLLLGMTVFAGLVNRVSFLPFAGILSLCIAWLDRMRADRIRVLLERSVFIFAMLLGFVFDLKVTSVTMIRLADVVPALKTVAIVCVLLALMLDLIVWGKSRFAAWLIELPEWLVRVAVAIVVLAGLLLWFCGEKSELKAAARTLHGIIPLLGPAFVLASVCGAVHIFWRKRKEASEAKALITFLVAVVVIVTIKNFVEPHYPWAARRYLAYAVPAIAILSGYMLSVLWRIEGRFSQWARISVVVIALALLGCTAKKSWHAWDRTEYDGITTVLDKLADQIGDNDVVIVDTPTWGTPLSMIYGKQVLNGKQLWERKSKDGMLVALKALMRMRDEGMRIRFLTTTRTEALNIYPVKLDSVTLDWSTEEVVIPEIIHSRRAKDFEIQERRNVFRLFTWTGTVEQ